MQVLVIANDELEHELMAQPIDKRIQLQRVSAFSNHINLQNTAACIDLLFENDMRRIHWLKQLNTPLIIINSVITPLTDIGKEFIRINGWNTFLKRSITEASYANEALKNNAEQLFQLLGRTIEWAPDIPGFITPRIAASIINEAFFALEEKVSDQKEIDIAMKAGTNYPYGPFEWVEIIGHTKIFELLTLLSKTQIRYRPSELLTQKALQ